MVNEDPTEKLIADLKAENARLKQQLAGGKIDSASMNIQSGSSANAADRKMKLTSIETISINSFYYKVRKEEEVMRKQLEENEKAMKNMQQSYEEKLAAAQAGVN